MNRRGFIATAGIATVAGLAGCSALAADPPLRVTIDKGDLIKTIEPVEVHQSSIGGLSFELNPTSGTYDMEVIDDTRKPEVFFIGEETRAVELHGESDWELPVDVVARGGQRHLLDSATIQRGDA